MKTNETRMRELRAWLAQTESTPLEEMDAFFTRRLSGYEAHMLAHWAADYENPVSYTHLFLQNLQYLFISSLSGSFFLFFFVL